MGSSIKRNELGIPLVGFGTYLFTKKDCEVAVLEALKTGYRHIDTAEYYNNEDAVGEAIKQSGIPREEIFITTKLLPGREEWNFPERTYDATIASCIESRTKLQVDQIDLYLIHSPSASKQRLEQWKALVHLKKEGIVKHIGVSNYHLNHLKEIEDAGLPLPEVNQIEIHPLCQQNECLSFMKKKNIGVIAYSSLAPLSTWRDSEGLNDAKRTADIKKHAWDTFQVIADKYNVSQAKVLLKWALQHNYCILPKSSKPERIRDNFDLFGFELEEADMATLDAMDRNAAMAWNEQELNPMEFP